MQDLARNIVSPENNNLDVKDTFMRVHYDEDHLDFSIRYPEGSGAVVNGKLIVVFIFPIFYKQRRWLSASLLSDWRADCSTPKSSLHHQ